MKDTITGLTIASSGNDTLFVDEVATTVTVQELINAIAAKITLPPGYSGALIRKLTRKHLPAEQTLEQVGIEDGEELIVEFERTAVGVTLQERNIQNLVLEVEHTGKRIHEDSLNREMTVKELLRNIAYKVNLPAGTRGVLIRRLTRKQLLPQQTLNQVGIQDGETLIVDFERFAGGSLEFYPDGKLKHIETTPEETPYLTEILREIRLLHKTTASLEKAVTEIKAEIKEIQNSTIVITGNDALVNNDQKTRND